MTSRTYTAEETRQAIRDMGLEPRFLCREPWESYYILRRGILPCCYGAAPIAPMEEWETAWNSPTLREMREYLAQGKLSPYCERSTGCPIVQRFHAEHAGSTSAGVFAGRAGARDRARRFLRRIAHRAARLVRRPPA